MGSFGQRISPQLMKERLHSDCFASDWSEILIPRLLMISPTVGFLMIVAYRGREICSTGLLSRPFAAALPPGGKVYDVVRQ